jgi:hypothetical protein
MSRTRKEVKQEPLAEVAKGPRVIIIEDIAMLAKLQEDKVLIGWDPATKQATIKEE